MIIRTNYLIEKGTNYSYLIDAIINPTFDSIWCLPATFVNQLPEKVRTTLLESLNNSVDKQDSEALLSMYVFAYGKMHAAKLLAAYENLPADNLSDIHIIDWGCGQAMATLAYYEYLRNKQLKPIIKSITLVEPSELALKRAALHVHKLFPTAEIRTVHKDFNSLSIEDIQIEDNQTVLHFFSNVLDIECFSIEQLAELIKKNKTHNFMVCVSPFINEYKNQRLYNFINCFPNANTLADYINQEWQNGWTVDYKVVEIKNSFANLEKNYNKDVNYNDVLTEYYSKIKNVIDIDGNIYKTTQIGSILWMAENLKVSRYRNGDQISNIENDFNWRETRAGVWCNFDNNQDNDDIYGKLYDWYAVEDKRGLAPEGWHIPEISEWGAIKDHYRSDVGGKLKSTGTTYWKNPNEGATNESGFTGLPGGYRTITGFKGKGEVGIWWSTRLMCYSISFKNIENYYDMGVSSDQLNYVRCVKSIDKKEINEIIDLHAGEYFIIDECLLIDSGLKFCKNTGKVFMDGLHEFYLKVSINYEGNSSIFFDLSRNSKLKEGDHIQLDTARFLRLKCDGKEDIIRIIE
jgi:uncharacterized protein (TIGR02145 family)